MAMKRPRSGSFTITDDNEFTITSPVWPLPSPRTGLSPASLAEIDAMANRLFREQQQARAARLQQQQQQPTKQEPFSTPRHVFSPSTRFYQPPYAYWDACNDCSHAPRRTAFCNYDAYVDTCSRNAYDVALRAFARTRTRTRTRSRSRTWLWSRSRTRTRSQFPTDVARHALYSLFGVGRGVRRRAARARCGASYYRACDAVSHTCRDDEA